MKKTLDEITEITVVVHEHDEALAIVSGLLLVAGEAGATHL